MLQALHPGFLQVQTERVDYGPSSSSQFIPVGYRDSALGVAETPAVHASVMQTPTRELESHAQC